MASVSFRSDLISCPTSSSTPPDQPTTVERQTKLTPDLLQRILKCKLGLRHVSDPILVQLEKENGVTNGCSLNINPKVPNRQEEVIKFKQDFDKKDPDTRCLELEDRIKHFVENCLNFDISKTIGFYSPSVTKVRDVIEIIKKTSYCLVQYEERDLTSDDNKWGKGLGRYFQSGRQVSYFPSISDDDLTSGEYEGKLIKDSLDETIKDSGYPFHLLMTDAVYKYFIKNLNAHFDQAEATSSSANLS